MQLFNKLFSLSSQIISKSSFSIRFLSTTFPNRIKESKYDEILDAYFRYLEN